MGLLAPPSSVQSSPISCSFRGNGQNNKFTLPLLGPPGEILDPSLQWAMRLKTACSSGIYRYRDGPLQSLLNDHVSVKKGKS